MKCHLVFTCVLAACCSANAGLLADYTFENGSTESLTGSYDFNTVGTGMSYDLDGAVAFARFPGTEGSPSYLQVQGPGGESQFTVSIWMRTSQANQGGYQGIFSTDFNTSAYRWQFDVDNGTQRLVSGTSGFSTITLGSVLLDEWQNIVIRKNLGDTTDVFINGINVGHRDANVGGLHYFRLGTNRNTDNFFAMDVAEVSIWDTAEDGAAIYAAGMRNIPEPTTLALLLGGVAAAARRKLRRG